VGGEKTSGPKKKRGLTERCEKNRHEGGLKKGGKISLTGLGIKKRERGNEEQGNANI